jgi:hypothetical protein
MCISSSIISRAQVKHTPKLKHGSSSSPSWCTLSILDM